jgi:probable HAF family extracellular repeat protein
LEILEDRCLLSYSITDLGTLGGDTSAAYAINAAGDVVGEADLATGQYGDAFLYSGGTMTDLGKITSRGSVAWAINASDQVVGYSYDIGDHAFLWQDGIMSDLGTLGGSESAALGINDAGQIVGNAKTPDVQYHAFLYQDGVMSDLGTLGGTYSSASAINTAGQVAGDSTLGDGTSNHHAFFYDGTTMFDLGTLGGANSYANAINDAGQLVGWSNLPSGTTEAYLYDGTRMNDLGTLSGAGSSIAVGINNAGQVVGYSYPAGSGSDYFHAFLSDGTTMTDLNDLIPPDSGWILRFAYASNDAGQIVGYGTNPDGLSHAFLLTPDGSQPRVDSVPISSSASNLLVIPAPLENVFFARERPTSSLPDATMGTMLQPEARAILSVSTVWQARGLVVAEAQPFAGLADPVGDGCSPFRMSCMIALFPVNR